MRVAAWDAVVYFIPATQQTSAMKLPENRCGQGGKPGPGEPQFLKDPGSARMKNGHGAKGDAAGKNPDQGGPENIGTGKDVFDHDNAEGHENR